MAPRSSICKTVLPNGVRVISERVGYVDSVSVGIWAQAGPRDEDKNRSGISHFVEHMLFKGTHRRSARQIAIEMDSVGGHLNAFTEKEFTCYHARVLNEHLATALDIISDMFLCSRFDPDEIEREKNVVLEEIKQHQDTPEEHVHDLLAQTLWKTHRLRNPVIGSARAVRKLTRQDLMAYVEELYRPDAVVVSAAGNVDHHQLVDLVAGTFGQLGGRRPPRTPADAVASTEHRIVNRPTEQVHFCLGTAGFAQDRPEKYTLAVMDAILGGGMSSRLFQEIRENRGLAYAIGSYCAFYQEAGLFAIYGGTSIQNFRQVIELTRVECEKIVRDNVTDEELERSKNQIRGALVLAQESMSSRMIRLARSEIYSGRIIRLDEIISSITAVGRDDVAEVASHLLGNGKFALAAIGPFKKHAELVDEGLVSIR